jgi:hypothetical protein
VLYFEGQQGCSPLNHGVLVDCVCQELPHGQPLPALGALSYTSRQVEQLVM